MRRFHIENRVRTACEDDALVAVCLDRLKVGGVGEDLGVNVEITDSAGDELIVLSAEVEDKYFFVHSFRPFLDSDCRVTSFEVCNTTVNLFIYK